MSHCTIDAVLLARFLLQYIDGPMYRYTPSFSCFLIIIYAINMPKLNTSRGKGKIKMQGDTLKAKDSGAECRGDA